MSDNLDHSSILDDPMEEPQEYAMPMFSGASYTAEELEQKIAQAQFEFHFAVDKIHAIEVSKTIREGKTKVILSSRAFHLLQNEKLRNHLIECFNVDPKFRITKELFYAFVHIEHQAIMDEYNFYTKMANDAKEDFKMLDRLVSWKQSLIKQEAVDRGRN